MARQSISRVIYLYNHTVGEHVQEFSTRRNLMKGLPNSSIMRLTELECTLIFSLTALCFDDVNSGRTRPIKSLWEKKNRDGAIITS